MRLGLALRVFFAGERGAVAAAESAGMSVWEFMELIQDIEALFDEREERQRKTA